MADQARGQTAAASCDGKEKFGTAALAHQVRNRYRPGRAKRHWDVYRCEFCGFYHAGTALRRAERPRRLRCEEDDDELV